VYRVYSEDELFDAGEDEPQPTDDPPEGAPAAVDEVITPGPGRPRPVRRAVLATLLGLAAGLVLVKLIGEPRRHGPAGTRSPRTNASHPPGGPRLAAAAGKRERRGSVRGPQRRGSSRASRGPEGAARLQRDAAVGDRLAARSGHRSLPSSATAGESARTSTGAGAPPATPPLTAVVAPPSEPRVAVEFGFER
jgi:hypothetical protein